MTKEEQNRIETLNSCQTLGTHTIEIDLIEIDHAQNLTKFEIHQFQELSDLMMIKEMSIMLMLETAKGAEI